MNKQIFSKLLLIPLALGILSCSRDGSSDDPDPQPQLEVQTYTNLHAPEEGGRGEPTSGDFTKFSFSKGETTTGDDWDIAFRGTSIIVNGGSKIGITDEPERSGNAGVTIVSNTLNGVTEAPADNLFAQDAANTYAVPNASDQGWYHYDSTTHLLTPIAGKIFVVRTHNGKYAKMEILSYYKDAPSNPDPTVAETRYFTFRYVYAPSGNKF